MPSPTIASPIARPKTAAPETPLFFENDGRPLYGVFHAPSAVRPGAPLLVHCHSLGVEQLTTYRAEVLCARAAAAAGVPAFRHHARGHGDSAGDFAGVTFEGLVDDAVAAAGEGLRRSGASGVVWLGVRFGSLVAAAAAARRPDTRGIALWEPVHRPDDYFLGQLRGLLFSQVAKGQRPGASADDLLQRVIQDGRVDVHGYYLHRELVASSRGQELSGLLERYRGPVFLAQIQARQKLSAPTAALVEALSKNTAGPTVAQIAEEPGWHFVSNPAWESPELVRGTAEWLDALA